MFNRLINNRLEEELPTAPTETRTTHPVSEINPFLPSCTMLKSFIQDIFLGDVKFLVTDIKNHNDTFKTFPSHFNKINVNVRSL